MQSFVPGQELTEYRRLQRVGHNAKSRSLCVP